MTTNTVLPEVRYMFLVTIGGENSAVYDSMPEALDAAVAHIESQAPSHDVDIMSERPADIVQEWNDIWEENGTDGSEVDLEMRVDVSKVLYVGKQ